MPIFILGYFDGIKGTVAVLPISRTSKSSFQGSEYLGIYFYTQIDTINGTNNLHYGYTKHLTNTLYSITGLQEHNLLNDEINQRNRIIH